MKRLRRIGAALTGPLHQNWRHLLDGLGIGVRAAIEVVIVVLFGAIPFFSQIFRANISTLPDHQRFQGQSFLDYSFSHGQLYLYIFAIFGTIMWLAVFDWRYVYTKIRLVLIFITLAIGFIISSFASFDPTFTTFADKWVVDLGYYLFAVSVVLYWVLIVSRKMEPPKASDIYEKGSNELATKMGQLP